MIYKVGDVVRVREDLVPMRRYDGVTFVYDMEKHKGTEVIIKRVETRSRQPIYRIKGDRLGFAWASDMFESSYTPDKAFEQFIKGNMSEEAYRAHVKSHNA